MEFHAHDERFFGKSQFIFNCYNTCNSDTCKTFTTWKKVPCNICVSLFLNNGELYGKCCMSQLIQSVNNEVKTYLRFLRYRNKEHVILHWVNNDWNVSKGGWDNTPPVVPGVFRPDDVDLVIPQVTELQQQIGCLLIRVITSSLWGVVAYKLNYNTQRQKYFTTKKGYNATVFYEDMKKHKLENIAHRLWNIGIKMMFTNITGTLWLDGDETFFLIKFFTF